MRINTNLDALTAQRNLSATGTSYSKSVQKLSSGLRINSAADDAAGLSISEKLKAQVNGLAQAQRNAQDGISMIQTGEGALNETHSILQRMRELAVQGANDTLQAADRDAIKAEMSQLSQEVDRIANTTQFNGKNLIDGSMSKSPVVSGLNANMTAAGFSASGVTVTPSSPAPFGTLTVNVASAATNANVAGTGGFAGALTAGSFTVNGKAIAVLATDDVNAVATSINAASAGVNATVKAGQLVLTSTGTAGAADKITLADGTPGALTEVGLTAATTNGTDANISVSGIAGESVASTSGNAVTLTSGTVVDLGASTTPLAAAGGSLTVTFGKEASLMIGANSGQTMTVGIGKMDSSTLGVDVANLDVSDSAKINQAGTGTLAHIDAAIQMVSDQRANLGAVQNRLEHTISNLGVAQQNLSASQSRIADVDVAAEMVNFTKTGILQQAGQAILAQANQAPSGILSLLRG
jgi:flagellin